MSLTRTVRQEKGRDRGQQEEQLADEAPGLMKQAY